MKAYSTPSGYAMGRGSLFVFNGGGRDDSHPVKQRLSFRLRYLD